MQAYICPVCGYLYDQESADINQENHPISFEELDPEWQCPVCGVASTLFEPTDSDRTPDEEKE